MVETANLYNVGDKVKVVDYLNDDMCNVVEEMEQYAGREMTIKKVNSYSYLLEEDTEQWCWNAHMLEKPKAQSQPFKVGDTVKVVEGIGWHEWCSKGMEGLEGAIATIISIDETEDEGLDIGLAGINGDKSVNGYSWNDQNLQLHFDQKREAKKFEVGDKVRVRKGLKADMENFIDSMEEFIGEEFVITYKYSNSYAIGNDWNWHDYMLELVEPAKPIVLTKPKVYLAAPFFNDKEIAFVSTVEHILRSKGLEVWSPRENQLDDKGLVHGTAEWSKAIFDNDIKNLEAADIVVAIMHGNYSDAGTAMEVGFAFNAMIPVVAVHVGEDSNLMIHEAAHANLKLEELVSYDFDILPEKKYEGKMF